MIVLGIESVTDVVGAAIGDGEGSGAALCVSGRRRHAETLAPAISRVLEIAGIGLDRLDAVAVDLGPGLFTGLRVGVATAKGLAQGLGIGVFGATSLEILAWAAFAAGWPGTVASVVDGRRSEVFAAHYARGERPGELVALTAPRRCRPERVLADLALVTDETGPADVPGPAEQPVLACGDGALRYRDLLETERVSVAGQALAALDPVALVSLSVARLDAGAALSDATDVLPVYLRDADVRINWVQRAPQPAGDR
jgi:tRNA threonylcarbamoyladenosine biosynthesis protein TsaB